VVTGGLLARAAEPAAGEADGHSHESACLNCGTALTGEYCHACGQKAHVHRTLGAFGHDLLHGVLHFEGKIWRTLPMLAWRPGELTRRYIAGERARFVSPLALFLFSVFLMFAVFSFSGNSLVGSGSGTNLDPQEQRDLRQAEQAIAQLEARRRELAAARQSTAQVDERLRRYRNAVGMLRLANGERSSDPVVVNTGWRRLDEGIKKASQNSDLLFYKLQTNAYKFSWALIPISLPFLWLLFLHRRRYREHGAYDHVVFITYSIAFMNLLIIVLSLGAMMGLGAAFFVLTLGIVPPIHMFRQLRGAYQLRWYSALWRTVLLVFFALLASTIFLLLLLALGVLG
jgi:ABC-type multidrug transport system fused ATPase/permease subunit